MQFLLIFLLFEETVARKTCALKAKRINERMNALESLRKC